jgi:hypothetical protein
VEDARSVQAAKSLFHICCSRSSCQCSTVHSGTTMKCSIHNSLPPPASLRPASCFVIVIVKVKPHLHRRHEKNSPKTFDGWLDLRTTHYHTHKTTINHSRHSHLPPRRQTDIDIQQIGWLRARHTLVHRCFLCVARYGVSARVCEFPVGTLPPLPKEPSKNSVRARWR